jgi:hypothetical protein
LVLALRQVRCDLEGSERCRDYLMATATTQQAQQGVSWWGWLAAIGLALWAAESASLRPLLVAFLVVLVLYQFDKSIKS